MRIHRNFFNIYIYIYTHILHKKGREIFQLYNVRSNDYQLLIFIIYIYIFICISYIYEAPVLTQFYVVYSYVLIGRRLLYNR